MAEGSGPGVGFLSRRLRPRCGQRPGTPWHRAEVPFRMADGFINRPAVQTHRHETLENPSRPRLTFRRIHLRACVVWQGKPRPRMVAMLDHEWSCIPPAMKRWLFVDASQPLAARMSVPRRTGVSDSPAWMPFPRWRNSCRSRCVHYSRSTLAGAEGGSTRRSGLRRGSADYCR